MFLFCFLPVLMAKVDFLIFPTLLLKGSYSNQCSRGFSCVVLLCRFYPRRLFSPSILWSSLISLHTLQALWLNYVLRSMSKHRRCVICREFPFIHYYSEGWAQLSASQSCAQHGSLCAQRGLSPPHAPLPFFSSPSASHSPCTHPLHPPPPPPGQARDEFTWLTWSTLGSPSFGAAIWELSSAPMCPCHK